MVMITKVDNVPPGQVHCTGAYTPLYHILREKVARIGKGNRQTCPVPAGKRDADTEGRGRLRAGALGGAREPPAQVAQVSARL